MTDEQIIERCKAAGIKWIPPHDDEDDSGAFPGSFDMVSMAEMRALLAAPSAVDAARACEVCDGVGTIGTPGQRCFGCEGYGRTVAGAPSVADAACVDCQENCQTCGIYKKSGSNRAMSFEEFCDLHIDAQDTIDRAWLRNFTRLWDVFRQGDPSSVADAAGASEDKALLDYLDNEGNPVDTIYFDDGKIIDVAGRRTVREAIRAAIAKESGK